MKKLLLVLGMITCFLGVSACGKTEVESPEIAPFISNEEAMQAASGMIGSLEEVYNAGEMDMFAKDAFASAALASWASAREAMGNYVEMLDGTVTIDGEDAYINVTAKGELRNVLVELILNETGTWKSVTANPVYTFGELMEKAALNTLLGMGTVFTVLILISLVISLFAFIPKIQNSFSKKESSPVNVRKTPNVAEAAVDNTIAHIIEQEEQSDNLELAAVIAAAIAASEGKTSTEGFVVRSIRRVKKTF